jgi:hypothetical protein
MAAERKQRYTIAERTLYVVAAGEVNHMLKLVEYGGLMQGLLRLDGNDGDENLLTASQPRCAYDLYLKQERHEPKGERLRRRRKVRQRLVLTCAQRTRVTFCPQRSLLCLLDVY